MQQQPARAFGEQLPREASETGSRGSEMPPALCSAQALLAQLPQTHKGDTSLAQSGLLELLDSAGALPPCSSPTAAELCARPASMQLSDSEESEELDGFTHVNVSPKSRRFGCPPARFDAEMWTRPHVCRCRARSARTP